MTDNDIPSKNPNEKDTLADSGISSKNPNEKDTLDRLFSKLIGQTLGEYEVKKEIGRGGTSIVYEAYQPSLKRNVALKVLWAPKLFRTMRLLVKNKDD